MPRYSVTTFGCQMNVHDSERLHEVLRAAGWTESLVEQDADAVVVNTCSVREKAEQKLRSLVGRLSQEKRRRPDMLIAIVGCVAQEQGAELLRSMRSIDVVVGPDNLAELPRLLADVAGGAPPVARTVFDLDAPTFLAAQPSPGTPAPSAFVTIMKGCDERCSFCIVPTTRGPERYRSSAEVVSEVARLVASGTREITLLGQTVNSYRDPSRALGPAPEADPADADESELAALLRAIAADVPALARLRYTSPHPRHVTPSLVAAHRDLDVLARHVHLPVQSGSDRVLKRMIRRYDRAEYVARAGALRGARPGLTLSTDVIVGFPGESASDFDATLSLVEEIGFAGLFGFKYSPRPHTPSLKLDDDVSEDEKSERLTRLFELSERLLAAHLATLVGTTQRVLVEGASKSGATSVSGRSEQNEIVHLPGVLGLDVVGRIVEVRVVRANKHSLEGALTEAEVARLPRLAEPPKPARRPLPVLPANEG